jgi:hypothetical protein
MPQTIDKTFHGQTIAGTFPSRRDADDAVNAFLDFGVLASDIQIVQHVEVATAGENKTEAVLSDRGCVEMTPSPFVDEDRDIKTTVSVHSVVKPAPIIDIFDKFGAEFNPNGSRNVREDVVGMTTGAAVGAIVGGTAGTLAGGPLGTAAGAAAGAVVGASAGAAAGKAAEHQK